MASKLREKMKKQAYFIGYEEGDILRNFPDAKKISDYQYVAKKDGMNIYIGWDSAFNNWKVFGRTVAETNVFQKLMNFLIGA